MGNLSGIAVSEQVQRKSTTTKRLIQAAALASALIPLGAVAVDAATINCVTSETSGGSGGCFGTSGDYTPGSGEQSNVWKFFQSFDGEELQNLLYTFEVRGIPETSFSLDVVDEWVGVNSENYFIDFPNSECIPLLDDQNSCVIFDVFATGQVAWDGLYYIEIRWFADPQTLPGGALNKPADDGRNHIFRSPEGSNTFTDVLATVLYDPELEADPEDPTIGGRGSTFSSFIAGRADVSVPEPATVLLLGSGMAVALYRRRRR